MGLYLKRWFRTSRGFTMIELLVVIAIIGILAVAVLSAINPIEQINKGKDTRSRSDAGELLGAIERYYTTQELFPWNVSAAAQGNIPLFTAASTDATTAYNSTGVWNFLGSLVQSNEVKPQFGVRMYQDHNAQAAGSEDFMVLKELNNDQVRVCFIPASRQFKLEAAKKCCPTTAAGGICASAGVSAGTQTRTVNTYNVCTASSLTGANTWPTDRNFICLP